jgi:hypothetical protein
MGIITEIAKLLEKEDKFWIQKAVQKKGSLRVAAQKAGAINKKGNIEKGWIEKKTHSNNPKLRKRAVLAQTLSKLHK